MTLCAKCAVMTLESQICSYCLMTRLVSPGVGKLRPAGRMRPSRAFCAAREHFLKLCHLEINATRGLTRRKSDGVLKKTVIAYNCPQSGIYRLRKGEDLFFFLETPPILRTEIPHCQKISQNCELMQFLL